LIAASPPIPAGLVALSMIDDRNPFRQISWLGLERAFADGRIALIDAVC
jgi:hypothetical protein